MIKCFLAKPLFLNLQELVLQYLTFLGHQYRSRYLLEHIAGDKFEGLKQGHLCLWPKMLTIANGPPLSN